MGSVEAKLPPPPDTLEDRLAAAALSGDVPAIRSLIAEGARPTALLADGRTAFHLACSRAVFRSTAFIEAMLAAPSINVNAVDNNGRTPLHVALHGAWDALPRQQENIISAVHVLLRAGADPNARSPAGEMPLHFGAYISKAVVEELLAAGADVRAVTSLGATAVTYAAMHDRMDAVCALLAAGASPNTRDTYASESLPLSVRAALTNPTLFDALMDAGADPAPLLAFGTEGTALTFEVTEPQVLRRLLAIGIDVNRRSRLGQTALFAHARSLRMMYVLIEAGADVTIADFHGLTVLHKLAGLFLHTPLDAAEALLNAGADVAAKSSDGRTPLDVARETGNEALCEFLLTRGGCKKLL